MKNKGFPLVRAIEYTLVLILINLIVLSCNHNQKSIQASAKASPVLYLEIEFDRPLYRKTVFGEAPQFAVWLENINHSQSKTIAATYRSATGNWIGKIECPLALPYWFDLYKREFKREHIPTRANPLIDALTVATPKEFIKLPVYDVFKDEQYLFIEVNVSGDYNEFYPAVDQMGAPDMAGVGQPSLIFQTKINIAKKTKGEFKIAGYTAKKRNEVYVEKNLEKISSAKRLIKSINITYASN